MVLLKHFTLSRVHGILCNWCKLGVMLVKRSVVTNKGSWRMFTGGLGSDHIVQRPPNYITGNGNFSRGGAGTIHVCCHNYSCPLREPSLAHPL